jgi:hypothetical protein
LPWQTFRGGPPATPHVERQSAFVLHPQVPPPVPSSRGTQSGLGHAQTWHECPPLLHWSIDVPAWQVPRLYPWSQQPLQKAVLLQVV